MADIGEQELNEEEVPFLQLVSKKMTKDAIAPGKYRGGQGYTMMVATKDSEQWGFMTVWNDILIPRFKEAFTLNYFQAMRYIILPQAVRLTIPPLINQFLNLMKNSSLAMTIGVAELMYQARQVESYTFKGFEAFSAATLVYLAISFTITGLMTLYDKKVLQPLKGR